jgi:hypothetical protein
LPLKRNELNLSKKKKTKILPENADANASNQNELFSSILFEIL